jgi:hypothetical protein
MHSFRPPKSHDTFVATVFGKTEKMSMMSMPKAEKMSMPKEEIMSPFGKTVKMSMPKAEKMSMPKEKMSMPKADKTVDAKAEKMSMPKGKSTNPPIRIDLLIMSMNLTLVQLKFLSRKQ